MDGEDLNQFSDDETNIYLGTPFSLIFGALDREKKSNKRATIYYIQKTLMSNTLQHGVGYWPVLNADKYIFTLRWSLATFLWIIKRWRKPSRRKQSSCLPEMKIICNIACKGRHKFNLCYLPIFRQGLINRKITSAITGILCSLMMDLTFCNNLTKIVNSF